MPNVGGRNIDQCMSICMEDPKTKEEYPNLDDRKKVCYAACIEKINNAESIEELILKWKETIN